MIRGRIAAAKASGELAALRRRIDEIHEQAPGMRETERAPAALDLMREAERLCARLPLPPTEDADLWRLCRTTNRLAVEYVRDGDREAGIEVSRNLVRAARSAADTVSDGRRHEALASGLQWLACSFKAAEEGSDDLATAREAVRERRRCHEETPQLDRAMYAATLGRLAEVLAGRGRTAEAVDPLREAVTQLRIIVIGAPDPDPHFSSMVQHAIKLGELSVLLDDRQAALAAAKDAVAAVREAAGRDPDRYEHRLYQVLKALLKLHDTARGPLDPPDAACLETTGEIVTVLRAIHARRPGATVRHHLACWLCNHGKYADLQGNRGEAISSAREAEALMRTLPDAGTERIRNERAQVWIQLALSYLQTDRVEEAGAARDEARTLLLAAEVPNFTQLGRVMGLDVMLLSRRGETTAAIAACREQIDFLTTAEAGAPTHFVVLYQQKAWHRLARLLEADGQTEAAAEALEQAGIHRLRLKHGPPPDAH